MKVGFKKSFLKELKNKQLKDSIIDIITQVESMQTSTISKI